MRRPLECLALLAVAALGRDATAQHTLRGVVRDSGLAAPLPGAVITVVDSSGATAARTISDANGAFSITASSRAATLHLIRIGYRPRDVALSTASSSLQLVMARIPPILDAVRVSDRELCPGSADRGPAFQYWEQARAGLLAEVVAREANPADVTLLTYERHERVGDDIVRRQATQSRTGPTKRPFLAASSPSTFARVGYMLESGADRVFSAPDADVLLDESFAATHCFHVQRPDAGHIGQVGLSFAPVPGRPDSIVDIAGTIWLDRATPSLRSFDFYYTNLEPAAARLPTGGHIEFHSVPNGVSFVERWALRLAILAQGPRSGRVPFRATRPEREDLVAQEVQETGGQVLDAAWLDGTRWQDSATGLRGTITQRGTGKPIANAIVRLLGTSDTAKTDDLGAFELQRIVPGKYMVEVVDTTLGMFSAPRTTSRAVEVTRATVVDYRASLPPASDVLQRKCKEEPSDRLTTIVAGRVVVPSGVSPERVELQATWQADYSGYFGANVSVETARRSTNLDDGGRFLFCKVSVERPLKLRAVLGTVFADTTLVPENGLYTIVDWRPRLIQVGPKP